MTVMVVPSTLAACEEVIERGLRTYVEAGLALAQIRDARLYRERHGTFEDYCSERWGMSRPRAYQLMSAAEQAKEMSTTVDAPLPTNEAQARELAGLPANAAIDVLREAEKRTQGHLTAAAIRDARAETIGDRPAVKPEPFTPDYEADAAEASAERIDLATGEVLDGPEQEFYSATGERLPVWNPHPKPAAPRRKALPDQFLTATIALTDKVAAIVRLAEDDRFTANTEKVATANRSDLIRAIDALAGVVAKLPERNNS